MQALFEVSQRKSGRRMPLVAGGPSAPQASIFGNLNAALHSLPCRTARILKFPERRNDFAKLRAEIEEMRKTVSVRAEAV
jgi:hypothetical protein